MHSFWGLLWWPSILSVSCTIAVSFRLFLFPVIAWAVAYFLHSQDASLITGALVSSFFFGLIHPGFGFITVFLIGLALVYIYYHRGLLPAMIAHSFTDAIPFTLFILL
ncbi:MAG: CPBP family intramembrane metalloprotease [Theionarchaea archaeon]|nr:CPBP family intramembrane metalloprotease [Theionarchaea archaeon]